MSSLASCSLCKTQPARCVIPGFPLPNPHDVDRGMVLRDLVSAKLVDFTGYRPLCQWSVYCVDDDTFVDADM